MKQLERSSLRVYFEAAVEEPSFKQMCQQEESYSSHVVIKQLLP